MAERPAFECGSSLWRRARDEVVFTGVPGTGPTIASDKRVARSVTAGVGCAVGALAKRRAGDEKKAAIYLAKELIWLGGARLARCLASRRPKSAMSSVRLITRHPRRLPATVKGYLPTCLISYARELGDLTKVHTSLSGARGATG